MQNNILLWLQLSFVFGGSAAGGALIKAYPNAEALFSVPPETRVLAGEISPGGGEKLRRALEEEARAKAVAAQCRNFGWQVITPESPFYPASFLDLPDPPLALFAAGDINKLTLSSLCAVVGTRSPSAPALRAAYDLASALSCAGVVTVSGGALGIDSAAHEGALTGPGGTVCVLGNGFGHGYLPEKAFLRARIQKNGLLLSEQPPFTAPSRNTFPRRNRLIAALASGVAVMQSAAAGGSMITASYAEKLGRRIFALSPEVFGSEGCDLLISSGAVPLASTGPVTAFFGEAEAEDQPFLVSGGALPPALTPESLSLEAFASLSGVTPAQAMPLWREIRAKAGVTDPAVPAEPAPKKTAARPAKADPSPGEGEPDAALKVKIADAQSLGGEDRAVFLALEKTPQSLDLIAEKTGLSAPAVMAAVTILEMQGLAATQPGNRVSLRPGV